MEQRIEIFNAKKGDERNVFRKAKTEAEALLKDGWFVHQMIQYPFHDNFIAVQLMVVYRRKA